MWTRDPSYETLINENWFGGGRRLVDAVNSLQAIQGSLQKWSHEVFGSVRGQLKKTQSTVGGGSKHELAERDHYRGKSPVKADLRIVGPRRSNDETTLASAVANGRR